MMALRGHDADSESCQNKWRDTLLPHKHVPLRAKGKSTRLLHMQLGPAYEHIRCKLSQHDLDNMPPYIALSYTWNQGSQRRNIECDESNLEVGDNLWQFLFEFRKRQSIQQYQSAQLETDISYLWIDAICIDQTDLQERNKQVAQMHDIYTNAESVIVWLGLVQAHEELVFLLLRYPELLEVKTSQEELIIFLDKPYFKRVWVVQEFILAKSLSVWCGRLSANATRFDTMLRDHSDRIQPITKTAAWPLFNYRRNFRAISSRGTGSSFRLRDLLLSFAALQSSEAYDRIYGFLGIASDDSGDLEPIRPDYSKPAVEVLIDVLRNQYRHQRQIADREDYELLAFLMQVLKVSRLDFARCIWRKETSMKEHIYVLTTFGRTTTSLRKLGSVSRMGMFTHVSEFSSQHMQLALFESAASLPELPGSSIRHLSSVIANPQTIVELDDALSRSSIERSVQSLIQCLSEVDGDVNGENDVATSVANAPEPDLDAFEFRQLLHKSLTDITAVPSIEGRLSRQQETRYLHRKYAVFGGTNGIIGVTCDASCPGRLPKMFDDIYMFDEEVESDKALLVNGRNVEHLQIVGTAIITRGDAGSSGIAQILQRLFRAGSANTTRSMSSSDLSLGLDGELAKVCFHCSLPELLELVRCGVLNEGQLQRLVEETFDVGCDDGMHLCSFGSGHHPSLRFGV